MEKYDFGGYVTRDNILCADGRTILHDCFSAQNNATVPLVWQHNHKDIADALGSVLLEARPDGIYGYAKCADTQNGANAKALVHGGHINSFSIWATELVEDETTGQVSHGVIKEVSLVLAGANPGALIDNPRVLMHSDDGSEEAHEDHTVATIYTGEKLEEDVTPTIAHANEGANKTYSQIYNSMTEEQQNLVVALIADLMDGDEDGDENKTVEHAVKKGEKDMDYNLFEQKKSETHDSTKAGVISHDLFTKINEDAKKLGSMKKAFLAHAAEVADGTPGVDYGIANMDLLYPEYQNVRATPDMIKRDDAWVATVIGGTNKTPFMRIKTMTVDVTADYSRARGYKKGHLKKEEVVKFAKRVTDGTTIYKKQRLDRDDIIDITTMDVVSWLKGEMQMMLREEIARAILVGDGRAVDDEDKIDETRIRPILNEDEFYAYEVDMTPIGTDDNDRYVSLVDQMALGMVDYKGSGNTIFFTTKHNHTRLKMMRDVLGRKIYSSDSELADAIGVSRIVDVPVLEGKVAKSGNPVFGIAVDLRDYTIGTNRGGQTTFFDDFDIDYNQYKYLYETRMSGALTRMDSAVIFTLAEQPKVKPQATVKTGASGIGSLQCSDLQENIKISDTNVVSGKLKYVSNYEGFSNTPEYNSGHYIALDLKNAGSDSSAKTYVQLTGAQDPNKKGFIEVKDGFLVARIRDEMHQKIRVRTVSADGATTETVTYALNGLILADEEE